MGRTLTPILAAFGVLSIVAAAVEAQDAAPRGAAAPSQRPVGQPLRIQALPPALEQILESWSNSSSRIQKLQGEHVRFVYDHVFFVEKRAQGHFYYESPDRGRIDIAPAKIGEGEVSGRTDKDGKPYKLQGDKTERWICDGQQIQQIDDLSKTVEVFPIPPQVQGQNIMEGPLPFLFGMKPEKAKQRFELSLVKDSPTMAHVRAIPRLQQDAANYKQADIMLDKSTYLPSAVMLTDPSGNLQTTYLFRDLEVNKKVGFFEGIFGDKDPFDPNLRGYKVVVNQTKAGPARPTERAPGRGMNGQPPLAVAQGTAPPAGQVTVPSLVGLGWKDAQAVLEKSGLEVRFQRGAQATRDELIHIVYEQQPKHQTHVEKGAAVTLTLYTKPEVRTSQKN